MMFGESPTLPIELIRPSSIPASSAAGLKSKRIDEGKLKKVCSDFESIFIAQMLKGMRQTMPQSGLLDGGSQQNMYLSLFDEELSKILARNEGMGLGKMLYQNILNQLKNNNPQPIESSAAADGLRRKIIPPE
jgi:flagellar protein FlgJ